MDETATVLPWPSTSPWPEGRIDGEHVVHVSDMRIDPGISRTIHRLRRRSPDVRTGFYVPMREG